MADDHAASSLVDAWSQAYNAHDLDALLACYGDDIRNTQHPWDRTVVGTEAMRAVYTKTFAAFPDIRLTVRSIIADDDGVAVRWTFAGTMRGPFAGQPPSGRSFALEGCEVFTIRDGRIVEQHGYWDKDAMFRQLGLTRPD